MESLCGGKMKGYENKEVPQKIITKLRGLQRRSKSYSITKLVCCPRKTYYKFTGVKELTSDDTQLIFVRGRGHHGALEVFDSREIELKKQSKNGKHTIYADIDMRDQRIIEIFTTTLSSNKVPEGDAETAAKVFSSKYKQLQAYDYFADELEGDLLVFFLFGDYSRFDDVFGRKVYVGIRPKLRCFTYNFERSDLEKVWDKMNVNLEEIEYGKATGQPPLMCGEEWECKSCGFAYTCLGDEPVTDPVEELK